MLSQSVMRSLERFYTCLVAKDGIQGFDAMLAWSCNFCAIKLIWRVACSCRRKKGLNPTGFQSESSSTGAYRGQVSNKTSRTGNCRSCHKNKNVSRWSCVARCEGVISGIEMGSCRQAPEAGLPSSLPWFKPQNEIQGFPKSGPKLEFLIAFYVCKRPLRRLRACILSKEICAATLGAKQGSFQHQPGLDNVTCQTQTS